MLPKSYKDSPCWLTIDVERLEDANFGITPKKNLSIDYNSLIDLWIDLCNRYSIKSCAFILGSFAKEFPDSVKKLANNGHEIASHGLRHELVYRLTFDQWKEELIESKKILEDLTGQEVQGYRSPSWSMPFQKRYYEALIEAGFNFSSSYFPFKTYMYGNSIDKKTPFNIQTPSGSITEIPVPKRWIPFSGGFYLRTLPFFITKTLFSNLIKHNIKPIIYTHPYELQNNLFSKHLSDVAFDVSYIMTFANSGDSVKRIEKLLTLAKGTS